jgi:hypothetical protein
MNNINKKLKLIKEKVFSLEDAFTTKEEAEKSKKDWKKKGYLVRLIINDTKNRFFNFNPHLSFPENYKYEIYVGIPDKSPDKNLLNELLYHEIKPKELIIEDRSEPKTYKWEGKVSKVVC